MRAIYDFVGVGMSVAESVAAALGLVRLSAGDPMRAVLLGANIGGDTDTIAAIAGQICGAYRGMAGLDAGMLAQVVQVSRLDLDGISAQIAGLIEERRMHGTGA